MIWIKRGLALGLLVVLGVAMWLWMTMLSPWFYERPAHIAPIEQRSHQVFVYGTLRFAPVRWVVMHTGGEAQADALKGFTKNGLDLSPAPQGTVQGLLLTVTPQQLSRLDRYERLGVRYRREEVELESGEVAWVYRRLAEQASANAAAPNEQALVGYKRMVLAGSGAPDLPGYHWPAANDATDPRAKTRLFKETS
ncbi:gamma-glutamylcyclotransferase family protein [Halomonas sp. GD1P12]|uniref:gamma-glutamylcyclotransferase family protein n=1 Tax=Halomonas sp. GD1P12 TaxID=2982691 RepID=UPI0021E3750B|nr:gamma-glutamylcyclotransferase family protein [Halomonas sp. GD1P12]UYF98386.1 gamma-glutamylcyclotransferase [Halomonas sp. GD1P12]